MPPTKDSSPLIIRNPEALHEAHRAIATAKGADWRIVRRILVAILGEDQVDYRVRHINGKIEKPLDTHCLFIGSMYTEKYTTAVLVNQRFESFTPVLGVRFSLDSDHNKSALRDRTRCWIVSRFRPILHNMRYCIVVYKGATASSIVRKFHLWMPFFIHYMSTITEAKWTKDTWSQCTFQLGRLDCENWHKEHLRASGFYQDFSSTSPASSPPRQSEASSSQ